MTINHINLPVSDVAGAIHFFETYFNFAVTQNKGGVVVILKNTSNFTLVLMATKQGENTTYPDAFHIGFLQDNEEQVNKIYAELKAGGIDINHEPKKIRDTFGFYFYYDGILLEVATMN